MNRKLLLSALTLLLSISLIAVSTMAWFTGSGDAGEALFTMGTVKVSGGEPSILYNKDPGKVNPGDCYVVSWSLKNIGTKRIQLRTKLDFAWLTGLDKNNIYIIPAPATDDYPYDWVLNQEASDKPVYAYLRGFADGILPEEEVELRLIIYFDGEMTDDDYQSEDFALDISVQAVQASNNSPSHIWGNIWELINDADYSFDYEFWDENWHEFDPMNIKCYSYYFNGDDDPEEPEAPDQGRPKIVLNETDYDEKCFAGIKFHLKNIVDTDGKKINANKDVNFKVNILDGREDNPVYNKSISVNFNNGNANNVVIELENVFCEKGTYYELIAEIGDLKLSYVKKLNK